MPDYVAWEVCPCCGHDTVIVFANGSKVCMFTDEYGNHCNWSGYKEGT